MPTNSCPVCESSRLSLPATLGYRFRVWRCADCGFSFVDRGDLAAPGADADYQDYSYNRSLSRDFDAMKPLYMEGLRQRIARVLGPVSLDKCSFLDVGCANGEYLSTARDLGFGTVAGVEIDESAASRARAYGEVNGTVRSLNIGPFDVVQVKNVLNNIADFRPFMEDVLRAIRPEGVILIDVLNQASLSARARIIASTGVNSDGRYGHLRPPHVVNGFTAKSLAIFLNRLDLKPILLTAASAGSPLVPYAGRRSKGRSRWLSLFKSRSMLISESRFKTSVSSHIDQADRLMGAN